MRGDLSVSNSLANAEKQKSSFLTGPLQPLRDTSISE